MNKSLPFLLLTFLTAQVGLGQHKQVPLNFATPNAASFAIQGNMPVNMFTGTPDISIPIYTVSEGEISVPLGLSYHPSAVQPNSHPGWTGLGMSLQCGGAITRVQHGFPDELKTSSELTGGPYEIGYYYRSNNMRLDVDDWHEDDKVNVFAQEAIFEQIGKDSEPDEFLFNFLGYSGRFFMGHDGKWKVSSKDKIRVELDEEHGIITADDLRNEIRNDMPPIERGNSYYYFNMFRLTVPDGTIYEFGGVTATEYSVPYRMQSNSPVVPTSWYLTKIKNQRGREVSFIYNSTGYEICAVAHQYSYSRYFRPGGGWFSLDPSCSAEALNYDPSTANGHLLFPVYLERIETSNSTVEFIKSESVELKYNDIYLQADNPAEFAYIENPGQDLKWYKLDQIKVSDKSNNVLKTYNFSYTQSLSTRLKLLSLTEVDKYGVKNSPYTFKYNSQSLPLQYGSDQVDHWGFYNGATVTPYTLSQPIVDWLTNYASSRAPDISGTFTNAELIEQIQYPTGGYTVLEFEPHDYSKEVSEGRETLVPLTEDHPGGGARIKKITSYENDGAELLSKEYYYVANFNGETDISQLRSSGVLGGKTQYYWPGFVGEDLEGGEFTYDLFSSNSLLPSFVNAQGSHVGYTEVVEKISGNGYSKMYFTNFGSVIDDPNPLDDNLMHMDERALNYTDVSRSVYSPFSSKAIERGHPLLIEIFDEGNKKVKSTKIIYEASSSDFARAIDLAYLNVCSNVAASAQVVFGTSFKYYTYNFNKISEEVTDFDTDGTGSIATLAHYEYHPNNNLITKIASTNSDGTEMSTEFLYPGDLADGVISDNADESTIEEMAASAHMINIPLEVTEFHDTKVTHSYIRLFRKESGIIVPYRDFETELTTPLPIGDGDQGYKKMQITGTGSSTQVELDAPCRETNTYLFDERGNIIQIVGEDGITTSYVWGYKKLFPVAKIINATYNEVVAVLGQTTVYELDNAPAADEEVRQKLQVLRDNTALDKALTTTYTYDPIYGITSVTDTNGKISYYSYDSFGRLRLIKDHAGNIIKRYQHQHQLR